MKPFAQYAGACLGIIAVAGAVAWALVSGTGRQALMVSAALAFAVQAISFGITRVVQRQNFMLGWGLGTLLRFFALVLYAIVVARLWRVPLTPALLSFAAFLFLTTLVEPIFLKR